MRRPQVGRTGAWRVEQQPRVGGTSTGVSAAWRSELESGRHNTDDGQRLPAKHERLPDCRGVGAEPPPPERLADHDSRGRNCVSGGEGAAGDRRDAQYLEEAEGHRSCRDGCRIVTQRHHAAADGHRRHRDEGAILLAPVEVIQGRGQEAGAVGRAIPQHEQPVRRRLERQRPDEGSVNQREHRTVGADADRQRQHCHHGKGRRAAHLPQCKGDVGAELFEPLK